MYEGHSYIIAEFLNSPQDSLIYLADVIGRPSLVVADRVVGGHGYMFLVETRLGYPPHRIMDCVVDGRWSTISNVAHLDIEDATKAVPIAGVASHVLEKLRLMLAAEQSGITNRVDPHDDRAIIQGCNRGFIQGLVHQGYPLHMTNEVLLKRCPLKLAEVFATAEVEELDTV